MAFRGARRFRALVVVMSVCLLRVSFGSRVRPRILGCFSVGMWVGPILSGMINEYSAGSGVIRVVVDFSGEIVEELAEQY